MRYLLAITLNSWFYFVFVWWSEYFANRGDVETENHMQDTDFLNSHPKSLTRQDRWLILGAMTPHHLMWFQVPLYYKSTAKCIAIHFYKTFKLIAIWLHPKHPYALLKSQAATPSQNRFLLCQYALFGCSLWSCIPD